MKPLVSVAICSYKHAKYLRTCLDSILNQKTTFDFEVIVGEDCSNDGSREILEEYLICFPEKLTVIFNEQNLGVTKNGINVRNRCRGKYIASCESDDFWCDEYKLQKQVDYLEAHPEIVAVGSNHYFVDDDGNNQKLALRASQTDRVYQLNDYLKYGLLIHGNSLMRRSDAIPVDTEKYKRLRQCAPTQGDVITRCLLYAKGGIYAFPEPMLCHREGGAVASSFSAQNINKAIGYTRMHRDILLALNEYFEGEHDVMPKLCHRMGYILMARCFGRMHFDMKEYSQLFRELNLAHKFLTIWQFNRLLLERIWNVVYWRFHDRSQY